MNTIRQHAIKTMARAMSEKVGLGGMVDLIRAEVALDALIAFLPTIGLRLVPEDATEEMVGDGFSDECGHPACIYRAMIAAAPNPLAKDKPND